MMEVCDSLPTYENGDSEESDDLETALQVWTRLYGHCRPQETSRTSNHVVKKPDDVSATANTAKRKLRRRVSSRDARISSSSDNETITKPMPPKRRLRPRSKRLVDKEKLKRGTKPVTKQPLHEENGSSLNIDEDSPEDVAPPQSPKKNSVPLRRSKRRLGRRSAHTSSRKLPIDFLDVSPVGGAIEQSGNVLSVSDQAPAEDDDSQKTILLDSLSLDSSEVIALEEEDDGGVEVGETPPSSIDKVETKGAENEFGSSVSSNNHKSQQTGSNIPSLSDISAKTAEENISSSYALGMIKNEPRYPRRKKTPKMQFTELDEIFFQPASASPKKPPPDRCHKRSADVPASSSSVSTTQESTCSSLWDDDSLWVKKSK